MSGRSKRSHSKWQKNRQRDQFVREAERRGVRSRSYFKIEELDKRFGLMQPGAAVLDLGAAPGGWSQYACSRVGAAGSVFAVDVLDMAPIKGVQFIRLDLSAADCAARLAEHFKQQKVDLILSDMAPNITGNASIDRRNYFSLYSAIFAICGEMLTASGSLAFKFFQTDKTSILQQNCKLLFNESRVYKPKPSRARSQESYLVSSGYFPHQQSNIQPLDYP